jgi:hypothetical protein
MDRYSPHAAPVDIEFDAGAALLIMRYVGKVSADGLQRAHDSLLDRLGGRAVTGLVLDVRESEPAYSPGELLENMESCVVDFPLERVALVTATDRERLIMLMETVAFPHGVRVRAFSSMDDARRFAAGL